MIVNVLIFAYLIAMAYRWGFTQGLFSGLLHLLLTVVAGSLAFAVWEPLVLGVLIEWVPGYAWGVGLVGPFAVFLLVLRKLADRLAGANLHFAPVVNMVGGGLCGLASGVLASGLTVMGVGFLPLGKSLAGYEPLLVKGNGDVVANPSGELWLGVDRYSCGFFAGLSGGVFGSGYRLDRYQPDLPLQAALYRLRYDPNGSVSASPASVRIKGVWASGLPLPVAGLDGVVLEELGREAQRPGRKLVVVQTRWMMAGGAYDGDQTLRVPPTQVRLLTERVEHGRKVGRLYAPVGWTVLDRETDRRVFHPVDSASAVAYGTRQAQGLDWVFVVPGSARARHLVVRHLRLDLPRAGDDVAMLIAALGRSRSSGEEEAVVSVSGEAVEEVEGSRVAMSLTNELPGPISKNAASQLVYDKRNAVVWGRAEVARPKGRIGKGSRVQYIQVPKHLVAVRLRVSGEQRRALLRESLAAEGEGGGVVLEDDRSALWAPIGYVWVKGDGSQRIDISEGRTPIRTAGRLPLAQMKKGDRLYLYFLVDPGVTIRSCRFGSGEAEPAYLAVPGR